MLINALFNKTIDDLTLDDLKGFFARAQAESDKLEFKSSREMPSLSTDKMEIKPLKENEVLKKIIQTVCAFLNTDGGVIIWGAPEGKLLNLNAKEKSYQGDLIAVKTFLEKDQIINKISDSINPTPNRINFKSISVEGGNIYIFEVLKSDFSPHQVSGTYYMRLDGQTKFAPHQYVEALMKKMRIAKLEMNFMFGEAKRVSELVYLPFQITIRNLTKFVNERNVNLNLLSLACILEPNQEFQGPEKISNVTIKMAEVLYPGLPETKGFLLVTTMNFGYGKRKIPLIAVLSGETAPIISSNYELEFEFGHDLRVSYTILPKKENVELQHEEEDPTLEMKSFNLVEETGNFMTPELWEKLNAWRR